MKVANFKAYYHRRIVMQVCIGHGGRDFAAYIGIIMDDAVLHTQYDPVESGGGGKEIPNMEKMSYVDGVHHFPHTVKQLESQGLCWRY